MRFAAVTATAKEAAVKQVIGMVLAAVLLVGCVEVEIRAVQRARSL
jgi:hypothetical protein